MYHCRVRFYLLGGQCEIFETVKEMSPLEHFTHEYLESDEPQESLTSGCDSCQSPGIGCQGGTGKPCYGKERGCSDNPAGERRPDGVTHRLYAKH